MSAVTAVPLRPLARGSVPKLWIAVGLMVLIAAALGWWGTSGLQRSTMPSGVQYQVIREGSGDLISSDDIVLVHFVGRKQDGEVFADTRRERQPLQATTDNFLPGVGEGLKLMRKGSVYRFWVPPSVWHGQLGTQQAPFGPNETLTFDVQVVDVQENGVAMMRMQQLQRQMQSQPGGNTVAPAPGGNAAAPAPSSIPAQ